MSDIYFSDRESGPRVRDLQDLTPGAWRGIVGAIESRMEGGAFGLDFPERCTDGAAYTTGTDQTTFAQAVQGEIPDLQWPLQTVKSDNSLFGPYNVEPHVPAIASALDLVEFCYRHVAQPNHDDRIHSYFGHYHLDFDRETGRESFRSQINRIFARNGLAYELRSNGAVQRLAPPVLHESLRSAVFDTGDEGLDNLLETARQKFLNHDADTRREGLEKLWDAWERLKTLEKPNNKRLSIQTLLDRVTSEPTYRDVLEQEARQLTEIGNHFHIRHTEIGKAPIGDDAQVDYLFHRLFAFALLILEKNSSRQD